MDMVLSTVPSTMWAIVAGVGLLCYFFSSILVHVAGIDAYARFVKPIAGIVALVSVFMYGGSGVQAMWEEKVRVAQEEADKAEAASDQANKMLAEERKKKQQVIKEYSVQIKERIVRDRQAIDADCRVPAAAITILNDAAKNPTGDRK